MLKKFNKVLVATLVLASVLGPSQAFAAATGDTSEGEIQVSGSVPEVFSLSARGVPGDLDMSPRVVVTNRLLGVIHLKYNVNIDTLEVSSAGNAPNGLPTLDGAGAADAPLASMSYTVDGCPIAIGAAPVAVTSAQMGAGFDVSAGGTAGALTTGVEEECTLSGTWAGQAAGFPLAGKYLMTIVVTMTAL